MKTDKKVMPVLVAVDGSKYGKWGVHWVARLPLAHPPRVTALHVVDLSPLDTPLTIDRLRLTVNSTSGRWYWDNVAALNEIEIIGMAAEPYPLLELHHLFLPMLER